MPSGGAMPPHGMPPRPGGPVPPMPPFGMMPPMYPPPQPPQQRHTFVRGIFVTLATTIFGFSLMLNIYLLLLGGVMSSRGSSRTNIVIPGDPTQKVALVPLNGLIDDSQYEKFDRVMDTVEKDKSVKAVVVEIDSPGGTVTASDLIYHRLVQFRKERPGVPVVASMGSLAASGGYYAACGTSYIFAQRTTLTGNIGVLMPRYNVSDLMKKLGVSENTIESTGARYKNAGSMFRPEDPQETKYFQELIDQAFGQFKAVVSEGRKDKLTQPLDEVANGKIYIADDAFKLGLIDKVGYMEDAVAYAASTAGLSKPSAVRYQETPSLSDLLLGAQSKSNTKSPGVTLQISPEMLDRLGTPRLMYLWRGD
jgi:protease-4